MSALSTTNKIIQAFSWMLIHSAWQGLALAIAAVVILAATKKTSPAIRYNLLLCLFAMFLLITIGTFFYEYNNFSHSATSRQIISYQVALSYHNIQQISPLTYNNVNMYIGTFNNFVSQYATFIIMLWFAFFIAKTISMAGNILYMHKVKHRRVYEPTAQWKEKLLSLSKKLALNKTVLLLESGYLKVPVVIGYFKPVILVPAGLLAGISAEQMEAVLLHELAHIKRGDYAVNFLQSLTEAIFFFNPGLLWISSLLKEERENCCDDMAIAQTNNKQQFVQVLISFKDYSLSLPGYAVPFSGHSSSLLNRVMRIVYQENKTLSIKENGIFITGIAMLSLMAFTIYPIKNTDREKLQLSKIGAQHYSSVYSPVNSSNVPIYNKQLANTKADAKKNVINLAVINTQLTDTTSSAPKNLVSEDEKTAANNVTASLAKTNLSDDKFYSRSSLANAKGEDMMRVFMNGGMMMASLKPDTKVAVIIDGVLYNESEVAGLTSSQVNSSPGKLNGIAGESIAFAQRLYPNLDLSKYGAYVIVGADANLAAAIKQKVDSP